MSKNKKQKALVPRLRFPEFRNAGEWEKKKLGCFCKIQTGKKDANEGGQSGAYPFFTCAERHIFSDSYSFDTEAILVAGNANVGKCMYYNGRFEAYQRTYVLTDFTEIDVSYLFAFLNARLQRDMMKQIQSSAMSYIRLSMLKEYVIVFPHDPAEQQKIADCLGSLDDLIAAESWKLEALREHKKGLMQQLFPREGETQPRLRFPEFRDAGEWKKDKLGEIATISKGKGISKTDVVENGNTPCIRYGELYTIYGEIIEDVRSSTNLPVSDLVLSEAGDVIIPASGETKEDIATCACVVDEGVALGSDLNVIRSPVDGRFFSYYLNGSRRRELAKVAQGDTVAHLYPTQLSRLVIYVPTDEDEQQRIADCLASLDALIAAQVAKLDALRTHKRGLMQQLFPSPEDLGT